MIRGLEEAFANTEVSRELQEIVRDVLGRVEEILANELELGRLPILGEEGAIASAVAPHSPFVNIVPGDDKVKCKPVVFAVETATGPPWTSKALPALRRHLTECAGYVEVAIYIAPMTKFGKKARRFLDDVQAHIRSDELRGFLPIGIFDGKMTVIDWNRYASHKGV